jgi:hypothetical protein
LVLNLMVVITVAFLTKRCMKNGLSVSFPILISMPISFAGLLPLCFDQRVVALWKLMMQENLVVETFTMIAIFLGCSCLVDRPCSQRPMRRSRTSKWRENFSWMVNAGLGH